MSRFQRLLLASCVVVSFATPGFAADPYVTSKMLDLAPLMQPPPMADSAEDKADVKAVIDAQAAASEDRKKQAFVDSDETVDVVFGTVLGPKFVLANLPKTAALFARIGDSEDDTVDPAKPFFGRKRPWIAHPDEIKAVAKPTKSGSYPSGHTTRATLYAIVMSAMVPEKQQDIWGRAHDYAYSRVVGGMHYPTDIDAGWRAGTAMAAVMMALPNFQADFAAAKAELRAGLGLAAK